MVIQLQMIAKGKQLLHAAAGQLVCTGHACKADDSLSFLKRLCKHLRGDFHAFGFAYIQQFIAGMVEAGNFVLQCQLQVQVYQ